MTNVKYHGFTFVKILPKGCYNVLHLMMVRNQLNYPSCCYKWKVSWKCGFTTNNYRQMHLCQLRVRSSPACLFKVVATVAPYSQTVAATWVKLCEDVIQTSLNPYLIVRKMHHVIITILKCQKIFTKTMRNHLENIIKSFYIIFL